MGKSVNGLGQFRGRVGGLVFARGDNGSQIIRTYQPVVKNPRTEGQLEQRAKVNLAGQISRAIPKNIIYSLGSNGRARRSELLKSLIKATSVTESGGNYNASLSKASVKLSKGEFVDFNPTFAVQGMDINVNWNDPLITGSTMTIVYLISHDDNLFQPFTYIEELPASQRNSSYSFLPDSPITTASTNVTVFMILTAPETEGTSISTGNANSANSNFVASLLTGQGLSSLKWYDSVMAGTGNIVP